MDPTGLSQMALDKLIKLGINELKAIYQCKDKGEALGDYLGKVRPLLDEASKTPLAGHDSVKIWLGDLQGVLNKAQSEVSKCEEIGHWNVWKRRKLFRRMSQFTIEIESILAKQVPALLLNIGVGNYQKVDKIDQKLDILEQRQVRIEMKLDVQAEAQGILDNLRKLPRKVFGTDANLAILENLLVSESQNEWVGLCGRGGIGKTLLAEQTFNSTKVREHFQNQFWVTVGQKPSIQQLLQNLAGQLQVKIENLVPADAKAKLFNALEGKKVLLLLDDVWDDGVPVLDSLDVTSGAGSKILVTTRHIKVLAKRHAPDECIVKIGSLTDDDSWKLFCEHAFGGVDSVPCNLDQTVIKAVVGECKGLPLALKVIARALAHETLPQKWRRQLEMLRQAHPLDEDQEVQLYGTLRLSYDSLQPRLQKCFIYFAAFPEDYDVDSAKLVYLWEGDKLLKADEGDDDFDPMEECFYLLTELIERSLIDLQWSDEHNAYHLKCRIHDVLRDFARYIIRRKEAPMECLFHAGQELSEVPSDWFCGPASEVTHLSLYDNPLESLPNQLKAPKLQVLLFSKDMLSGGLKTPLFISPEFLESFPSLTVLDLDNRAVDSLPESVGSLKNLIYLDLSRTGLRKLPQRLQELTKLEYLSLRGCTVVEPWPFDISRLQSLSTLRTDGCKRIWDPVPENTFPGRKMKNSLKSLCSMTTLRILSVLSVHHKRLPSHMIDSLSRCAKFSLRNCSKLTSLPNLHERSQKLVVLDLHSCITLCELPDGFTKKGAFPNLQMLLMSKCIRLEELPTIEEGAFPQLVVLDMQRCSSLVKLPLGFGKRNAFKVLKRLNLSYCGKLLNIPPIEDGAFPQLKGLDMYNCANLRQLPSGFTQRGAFPTLEILHLGGCERLQEIPPILEGAFQQLKELNLTKCTSVQQLPNGFTQSGAFPALETLYLGGCEGLQRIPPIEHGAFPQLRQLDMKHCTSMQQLPSGFTQNGSFPALETLCLDNCKALQEIPPVERGAFGKLKELYMRECYCMRQLSNGFMEDGAFPALRTLVLDRCETLEKIPPIEQGAFPHLKHFEMRECIRIQQLPNGFTRNGVFPALETLYLGGCEGLQKIPPFEQGAFPQLKRLYMSNCTSIQQLPNGFTRSGAFPALEILYLGGCNGLQEIPPIEQGAFPRLKKLSMSDCKSVQQLPKGFTQSGAFPALEKLELRGCESLQEILPIEVGAFPQLKKFYMSNCTSLRQLPNGFSHKGTFPALEILHLSGCTGLSELPIFEEGAFPQLDELNLRGCHFEILPRSCCHLHKLAKLDLTQCGELKILECFTSCVKEYRDPTRPCFASLRELGFGGVDLKLLPHNLYEACPALEAIDLRSSSSKFLDIPANLQILEDQGKLTIRKGVYRTN